LPYLLEGWIYIPSLHDFENPCTWLAEFHHTSSPAHAHRQLKWRSLKVWLVVKESYMNDIHLRSCGDLLKTYTLIVKSVLGSPSQKMSEFGYPNLTVYWCSRTQCLPHEVALMHENFYKPYNPIMSIFINTRQSIS
jgi:hypothetical protein